MKTSLIIAMMVVGSIAVVGLGLVVYGALMIKNSADAPEIQEAKIELQREKLALKQQKFQYKKNHIGKLESWEIIAILAVGSIGVTGSVLAVCYGIVLVRIRNIVPQTVGEKTILVHYSMLKDSRFVAYLAGLMALEDTRPQNPQIVAEMARDLIKALPQMSDKVPTDILKESTLCPSVTRPLRNC